MNAYPRELINTTQGDIGEIDVVRFLGLNQIQSEKVEKDRYKIDFICRYKEPIENSTEIVDSIYPKGGFFLVQVKSTRNENLFTEDGNIEFRFTKSDVEYWMDEGLLTIIFVVDLRDYQNERIYWASVEDHLAPIINTSNDQSDSFVFGNFENSSNFRQWIEIKYESKLLSPVRPNNIKFIEEKLSLTGISHLLYRISVNYKLSNELKRGLETKNLVLESMEDIKNYSFDSFTLDLAEEFYQLSIREKIDYLIGRFERYLNTNYLLEVPFQNAIDDILEFSKIFNQVQAIEYSLIVQNKCPNCGNEILNDERTMGNYEEGPTHIKRFVGCSNRCGYVIVDETESI